MAVATVETRAGLVELITVARDDRWPHRGLREGGRDRRAARARGSPPTQRLCWHALERAPASIGLATPWPTSIAPKQLSLDAEMVNGERAAIFQALGRYDEALAMREEAATRQPSFENVAALVGLHAERGEIETRRTAVLGKPQPIPRRVAVSTRASRLPDGAYVDERGRA